MPDPCVVCGGSARAADVRVGEWAIVRCTGCGTRTLDPMPAEVHMDGFDDGSEYDLTVTLREAIVAEHERTLAVLEAVGTKGRLLDVGCGTGLFLGAASSRGWQATGIDPSKAAVDAAREAGHDVHHGLLEDASFERGSFDAISLLQVVEHLPDPRPLLERCRDLLRRGGVLLVATPNPASWLARATRERFAYWIPPTHVAWYPPGALARLTADAGFKPARTRTWGAPALHEGMTIASAAPGLSTLPYRVRALASRAILPLADALRQGTIVEQFSVKP